MFQWKMSFNLDLSKIFSCEIQNIRSLSFHLISEAVTVGVQQEKVFLEISQTSQENTCLLACNFIKKKTLAQVFSCEFCEISKNTFFIEHLLATASVI